MQINSVSELCLQFVHIHFHISCVHADDSFFRSLRSSEKYICYISFNIFLDIVIIKCKSFFVCPCLYLLENSIIKEFVLVDQSCLCENWAKSS